MLFAPVVTIGTAYRNAAPRPARSHWALRPAHASFSSQAIDVQTGASQEVVEQNEIPGMFRDRLLSVRSFDDAGMMIDADVVDGHSSSR